MPMVRGGKKGTGPALRAWFKTNPASKGRVVKHSQKKMGNVNLKNENVGAYRHRRGQNVLIKGIDLLS